MQMIHWSLRHVRSQYQILIMLDVLAVHFGEDLLRCMDSLSFKYMFIPAKLTWLIQPCDTHCFALYKRFLKLLILRYKARHHHQTIPTVLVWLMQMIHWSLRHVSVTISDSYYARCTGCAFW